MKSFFSKFIYLAAINLLLFIRIPNFTNSITATYTVTNTFDSGAGSLRQAIINANNHPGEDHISFNIPKTDLGYSSSLNGWVIQPGTALSPLSDANTIIDGATQTANQGDTNPLGPEITIDGSFLGTLDPIFDIRSNTNQILGLAITKADGSGVRLYGNITGNIIKDNYIGIAADTSSGSWGNWDGVSLENGANANIIAHNVISGNDANGINIMNAGTDSNMIRRNTIGLDPTGTTAIPNLGNGILLNSATKWNTIGGEEEYRNIISSNTFHGVQIDGSDYNTISYNFIGLDVSGTQDLGNKNSGIYAGNGAWNNLIQNNIISGNTDHGVYLTGTGTAYNYIRRNIIGLDFQQKNIIPNGKHGVGIYNGAQRNEVGHVTIPDSTNYIFGNGWSGVVVVNVGSDNNIIAYNHIFENDYYGVAIVDAGGNTIYRNTIWHNGNTSGAGVFVDGSTAVNNRIQQNSIYDSFGLGIELTNGGNTQLSAPTIHQADCEYIAGIACAGCTVEIFSSDDDEGKLFEYTLTANSVSGDFEWGGWLNGPFVTVTADSGNNTSQFSAPFSIGGCTRIFMPLVIASP